MSVTGTTREMLLKPIQSPYWNTPKAWWLTYITVTGNLSGGTVLLEAFLRESGKRNLDIFSIEGYNQLAGENLSAAAGITLYGFESLIGGISPIWGMAHDLISVAAGAAAATLKALQTHPRLGLHPFQQREGATLGASVGSQNNTNGVLYEFGMWGYLWDGEAMNHGGPVYPAAVLRPAGVLL